MTPNSSSHYQNWLSLLAFLKPYKARFASGILFGILNGLSGAALMKGLPYVIKTVFSGQQKDGIVMAAIALVPVIMITRAFFGYLSTYFMSWVGTRVITDLRQRVFEHIQTLSLDFFKKSNIGDLMARITHDCQQAQSAVTTVIADSVKHPFTVIVVTVMLMIKDWQFFLGAVVLAPLCVLPIAIYGRKVRRVSKLTQENQGEITSCLHENLTGAHIVKAFHMEDYENKRFWDVCYRQFAYQMRIVRSINILSPLIEIVAAIGASVALVCAFHRHMSFDQLFELLLGIYLLYDPIKNLSKLHTTIQKSLASTDRILTVLNTRPTVVEKTDARTLKPIQDFIRFDDVSFRYDTKWVLQNVDLLIPHGQTIAIVGPSGAGKTTLLNLILRFYDPRHGTVSIDGIDLREVSLLSLRSQTAIVTQETILFNDTIRNNIRYGSFDAPEEKIIEAARKAHAHDFIVHQIHGYDTIVGEKGAKLSGGQKQRLSIARAILKNPAILLLDEATSALDTESERYVQEAIDELIRDRTVVVIAHRLSTVQRADRIIVMEHGRIVEQGKHAELLATGKLYRKLHDLQFSKAS
ncbi:MAG: ABC transporter ATP-binding protein [Verrucomicrobiae bacterium]|nr:ABC transporter ATP-binding protein [Verrucomicrobiae bacterium]